MNNIKRLMENRHRITYVRITALTKDELPIETIEGAITGGSISVDGASAVRRTCNLTLVSQDTVMSELNWAVKNKFKLEIGILDITTNEIVWFKQGIYGITSFSLSESTTGITISIQGKDKMGYLDGTFGGVITAQTDFATWDEIDTEGNITNRKVLIHDIIRNIVHQIGLEPYHNIFISGLNTAGYELWDYHGDKLYPIYYFYDWIETKDESGNIISSTIGPVANMTLDGNLKVNNNNTIALKDIPENDLYQYALMETGEIFSYGNKKYKIAKIEHGEAAGYYKTDLIYSNELIAFPGETIVSVLDKIRDFLGMYEYFYDLDGHFVFQQKTSSVEGAIRPLNSFNSINQISNDKYSYVFEDTSLITQISSSPDISNIKNDIVVWGKKPTATGNDGIPIHARFAVAHKPMQYIPMERYEGISLTYLGEVEPEENEQLYYKDENNYYKIRRQMPYGDNLLLNTNETGKDIILAGSTAKVIGCTSYSINNGVLILNAKTNQDEIYYRFMNPGDSQNNLYTLAAGETYIFSGKVKQEVISGGPYPINVRSEACIDNTWTGGTQKQILASSSAVWVDFSVTFTIEDAAKGYYLSFQVNRPQDVYYESTIQFSELQLRKVAAIGLVESTTGGATVYQKKAEGYYSIDDKSSIYKRDPVLGFIECEDEDFTNLTNDYYILKSPSKEAITTENYDWREILYQMALDYFQHGEFADYPSRLMQQGYYNGKTGYEPFYTDMQAFWRLLYDPSTPTSYVKTSADTASHCNVVEKAISEASNVEKINGYVMASVTHNNSASDTTLYYLKPYTDEVTGKLYLLNQKPNDKKNIVNNNLISTGNITVLKDEAPTGISTYEDIVKYSYQYPIEFYKEIQEYYSTGDYKYWNKTVILAPEDLIFWIDFLDTGGPVGEYSIQEIGTRSIAENVDNIKSIYQRKTPEVEFIIYPQSIVFNTTSEDGSLQLKQFQISPELASVFNISSQGLSAADRIDELVYKHVCGTESINISAVPLYHLEPNTLIYVSSENIKINGDYYITSFTVPLTYNGTMSITATKVVKRLK